MSETENVVREMIEMLEAPARKRNRPAVKVGHLEDLSGGKIVDVLEGVTAFHGSPDQIASTLSARRAFGRVIDGVAEIIAKASPELAQALVPGKLNGRIAEMGEVVAHDTGLSVTEANETRAEINGYIETAVHAVHAYAQANGISAAFESRVAGPYQIDNGALRPLNVKHREGTSPGLGVSEMNAALARWADCLATLADVVNAEPVPAQAGLDTTP